MRNQDDLWREYVKELEDFMVVHRREPKMVLKERYMTVWLDNQRVAREQGKLCDWKLELLRDIDELSSEAVTVNSIRKLYAVELYVSQNASLPAPDGPYSHLYKWIKKTVRQAEKGGVPHVLRKRLESIGVDFSNKEWSQGRSFVAWEKQFEKYTAFCDAHGRAPRSTGPESSLYRWGYQNRAELQERGLPTVGKGNNRKNESAGRDKEEAHTSASSQRWLKSMAELARFLENYHRLPKETDDPVLARWLGHQESRASEGTLADWKRRCMEDAGLVLKTVKVNFTLEKVHAAVEQNESQEGV